MAVQQPCVLPLFFLILLHTPLFSPGLVVVIDNIRDVKRTLQLQELLSYVEENTTFPDPYGHLH